MNRDVTCRLDGRPAYPASFCDTSAIFGGAPTLLRRVCPKPLSAEWWVSTCAEVDATAVHLNLTFLFFGTARLLDLDVLQSAPWLGPALAHVAHVKVTNLVSARERRFYCARRGQRWQCQRSARRGSVCHGALPAFESRIPSESRMPLLIFGGAVFN